MLGAGAAVGLKLYYAPFMKNHAIWASAILAVYLFSVSGGMHNIIRGVPMQHIDRNTGQVPPPHCRLPPLSVRGPGPVHRAAVPALCAPVHV